MPQTKPFTAQEMEAAHWSVEHRREITFILEEGTATQCYRHYSCCPKTELVSTRHQSSYRHIATKFCVTPHRLRRAVMLLKVLDALNPIEDGETNGWKKI